MNFKSGEKKSEDAEGNESQIRGPVVFVSGSPEDLKHIEDKLMSYLHFQNLHILVHKEIQTRVKDEDNVLNETQKKTFKAAQKCFSDPLAIRSLFQERNDKVRLKREITRLKNEEESVKNSPGKLEELLSKRAERQLKLSENPKKSSRDKSDVLLRDLAKVPFFQEFLEAGKELKSHVIMNLVKTLETARSNAFEKYKKAKEFNKANGISFLPSLDLPQTQALARTSNFFVNLCEISARKISESNFSINLDSKSRNVHVGLDLSRKEEGLKFGKITKIGIVHGKIAVVIMYKKTKALKEKSENRPEKLAGLDLGLKTIASIFVDDDTTPSILLKAGHLVQYNAKFNEFNSEINGQVTETLQEMAEMRKATPEKKYKTHKSLLENNEEYRSLHKKREKILAKQRPKFLERKNFISDQIHKLAIRTLEYLHENAVTKLIVSTNLGDMKNKGMYGTKDHNRRFVGLPMVRLVEYIKLNSWLYDIDIKDVNEAYTSKTSCFDGDVVGIQKEFLEERARVAREFKDAKEARFTANKSLKEDEKVPLLEFESFLKSIAKPDGTALGGSRRRGKYVGNDSKSYWHADINGAVNHIRIAGHEIAWTPLKRAKVYSPVIIQSKRGEQKVHGKMLEFNVIDTKNGVASFLKTVLASCPVAAGRLEKESTLAS